jgi:hypothetical protein
MNFVNLESKIDILIHLRKCSLASADAFNKRERGRKYNNKEMRNGVLLLKGVHAHTHIQPYTLVAHKIVLFLMKDKNAFY